METAVLTSETGAAGAVGAADGGFGQTVEGKDEMICLCGQSFPDGSDPRFQIGRMVPKRLNSLDLKGMRYFLKNTVQFIPDGLGSGPAVLGEKGKELNGSAVLADEFLKSILNRRLAVAEPPFDGDVQFGAQSVLLAM